MAEDFLSATNVFLNWLLQRGFEISSKCVLTDLRARGRGRGISTGDYEKDEIIFKIPRNSTLSVQNAVHELSPNMSSLTAQVLEEMPCWLSLTVVLMSEMHRKNSQWSPYLAVLPSKLDSLIFWSPSELAELQASAVVHKIGKFDAEKMFREKVEPLGLINGSVELFHQVASTIMAYAFDIPQENPQCDLDSESGEELVDDDDPRTVLTMVPLADMLNADGGRNNARLVYEDDSLEMRSIKKIKEGEEIFNDYGSLPRSDLLRRYGYITDSYAPYDVIELSTESMVSSFQNGLLLNESKSSLKLKRADIEARLELATRGDVYEESYNIVHSSLDGPCIPNELVALIYLFLINESTFARIRNSSSVVPSRSKMTTELLGRVLSNLLKLREGEYATTLEEDNALLNAEIDCPRRRMAIKVRHGEKIILREAMKEAALFHGSNREMRWIATKREAAEGETDPPKKVRTR